MLKSILVVFSLVALAAAADSFTAYSCRDKPTNQGAQKLNMTELRLQNHAADWWEAIIDVINCQLDSLEILSGAIQTASCNGGNMTNLRVNISGSKVGSFTINGGQQTDARGDGCVSTWSNSTVSISDSKLSAVTIGVSLTISMAPSLFIDNVDVSLVRTNVTGDVGVQADSTENSTFTCDTCVVNTSTFAFAFRTGLVNSIISIKRSQLLAAATGQGYWGHALTLNGYTGTSASLVRQTQVTIASSTLWASSTGGAAYVLTTDQPCLDGNSFTISDSSLTAAATGGGGAGILVFQSTSRRAISALTITVEPPGINGHATNMMATAEGNYGASILEFYQPISNTQSNIVLWWAQAIATSSWGGSVLGFYQPVGNTNIDVIGSNLTLSSTSSGNFQLVSFMDVVNVDVTVSGSTIVGWSAGTPSVYVLNFAGSTTWQQVYMQVTWSTVTVTSTAPSSAMSIVCVLSQTGSPVQSGAITSYVSYSNITVLSNYNADVLRVRLIYNMTGYSSDVVGSHIRVGTAAALTTSTTQLSFVVLCAWALTGSHIAVVNSTIDLAPLPSTSSASVDFQILSAQALTGSSGNSIGLAGQSYLSLIGSTVTVNTAATTSYNPLRVLSAAGAVMQASRLTARNSRVSVTGNIPRFLSVDGALTGYSSIMCDNVTATLNGNIPGGAGSARIVYAQGNIDGNSRVTVVGSTLWSSYAAIGFDGTVTGTIDVERNTVYGNNSALWVTNPVANVNPAPVFAPVALIFVDNQVSTQQSGIITLGGCGPTVNVSGNTFNLLSTNGTTSTPMTWAQVQALFFYCLPSPGAPTTSGGLGAGVTIGIALGVVGIVGATGGIVYIFVKRGSSNAGRGSFGAKSEAESLVNSNRF